MKEDVQVSNWWEKVLIFCVKMVIGGIILLGLASVYPGFWELFN